MSKSGGQRIEAARQSNSWFCEVKHILEPRYLLSLEFDSHNSDLQFFGLVWFFTFRFEFLDEIC